MQVETVFKVVEEVLVVVVVVVIMVVVVALVAMIQGLPLKTLQVQEPKPLEELLEQRIG